ncbi:MAG: DMT family transporter [Bacteroidales bacterium]
MTEQSKGKGIVAGVLAAIAFGMIPAFSIPPMQAGMAPVTVLFYRFFLASAMIAIIFAIQRKSLKISKGNVVRMIGTALFYCASSGFLIMGYKYMTAGVTGVIHFTYPIFVLLILFIFFRERLQMVNVIAIAIAIAGIYCLGVLGADVAYVQGENTLLGFLIVLASGVGCASYMVSVNKSKIRELPSLLVSFWLLFFSAIVFAIISIISGEMVLITEPKLILNLSALALIATVISNVLLVYSIKIIGSNHAAILGAIEPVTSVFVGVILFGDIINLPITIGILLIFLSVGLCIAYTRK